MSQLKVFIALNTLSQTPFQRFYFLFFFIYLVYQLSLSLNSVVFLLSTCLLAANHLAGGWSTLLGWPTLWPCFGGCGCRKVGDQGKREKGRKCTDSWEGSWVSTAVCFCVPRFLWSCISEPGSAWCLWPTRVECFVPTALCTFAHMLSFVHTK